MKTQKHVNPKTGRAVTMRVWDVDTRKAIDLINSGGAKALSWAMLSDDESLAAMDDEQSGDSADSNFALNVFENALDWALGLKVIDFLQACKTQFGRYPKRASVACTHSGDVYIVLRNGTLW